MRTVELVQEIAASPQEVWDFISDIRRAPEWVVVMQELLETTDNPVRAGSEYKERSKIGPKESETTWHVGRFDADSFVQVHECNEPDFQAILTMRVEPSDSGAVLHHTTEYELMPNMRLLGWLMETLFINRLMNRQLHESVQHCKRIIERERGS